MARPGSHEDNCELVDAAARSRKTAEEMAQLLVLLCGEERARDKIEGLIEDMTNSPLWHEQIAVDTCAVRWLGGVQS